MSDEAVSRWEPWLFGVTVAAVAAGLHAALHPERVVGNLSDEALLLPLGLRSVHPELYAGDRWLDLAAQVFSIPYSWITGILMQIVDEPVVALRLLSFPFHALFLAGIWRLAQEAGVGKAGRWLALGFVLLPVILTDPTVARAAGSVIPGNGALLANLTLAPGAALPRDLVFAFFPHLWIAARRAREAGTLRTAGVYFVLGVLGNVHPLTAVHLAGLLFLVELDGGLEGSWNRVLAGAAAFLVGVAPYAVQYLDLPRGEAAAPAAILSWRVPGITGDVASVRVGRVEPLLWLGAGVLVLRAASALGAGNVRREMLRIAAAAVLLAVALPYLGNWVEAVAPFQFDRLTRFAAVLLAVLAAAGVEGALAEQQPRRLAVGAGLMATVLIGPVAVRAVAGGAGSKGILEAAVRMTELERGAPVRRPVPTGLVERTTPGAPDSGRTPGALDSFREVCAYVRTNTEPGDPVLVPPEEWGAFRVHARRPSSVTRKEGGFALTFLRSVGREWFDEYAAAARTYAGGTDEEWRALAMRYRARYAVSEPGSRLPAEWTLVLETPVYSLHQVR